MANVQGHQIRTAARLCAEQYLAECMRSLDSGSMKVAQDFASDAAALSHLIDRMEVSERLARMLNDVMAGKA